mmetsp:Transcript_18108/g.30569  ORF Transcript_18108/g.30569 Transcript_18108/m.30569 type:complete len:457 (+) Transcript_18108:65-1435(+)
MAAEPPLSSKCLAEFIGTFLLVFTVECNVSVGNPTFAGLSIGMVLFVAIQALGGISGGNFNPAVSVSLGCLQTLKGPGMDWKQVAIYSAVQILGGFTGGLLAAVIFGHGAPLQPATGYGIFAAGMCELLYTFMLCFVVLNVAAAKKNKEEKGQYFALAIGFCIVSGAYGAGAISGGAFNPAVAIGLDLTSIKTGFGNCFVYILFQLLGSGLAALAFCVVRPADLGNGASSGQLREQLSSEFIGTFILVLTVTMNILASSPAGALSIACSLSAMIYALGDVSGGHFNPAVSCAVFCSGRDKTFTVRKALLYAVVQIIGGSVATLIGAGVASKTLPPVEPKGPYHLTSALLVELIFTFTLAYVVLSVAVSAVTKSSHFFGLAIGFCVVVGGFAAGNVSGAALNPAVSAALALTGGGMGTAIGYGLVQLLAGMLAASTFKVTHPEELESAESKSIAADA